jgi:hypothetical protein
MRSRIFNLDWERFDHRDAEQRKQLSGALQYFLALPDRYIPPSLAKIQAFADAKKEIRELQVKLQEFTTTGDFPASILPLIEKYHIIPQYDNGYEQLFDIRDFSTSKRNGFTVSVVQSGLSFRRVKVGEKLKVYQMSGEKEECYFDFYGGALGWHRMLFDDGDWWTIEDNAIEFRNKAYLERASIFYALIEAVASVKSACIPLTDVDCDDCDAIALIDGNALNLAAQTILVNCANKGYGISPQNISFIVLAPVQMRGRVRRALGYNYQKFPGTEKNIDYSFTQITTMMLQNTNQIFVILPKITLKGGYRMDLTLFSDFDILSYTDTQAGWMRYGGCIGDIDQIECIDMTLPSGR